MRSLPLPSSILICALFVPVALADEDRLDIPPRLQWNANGGYCGEVSLISAGLYYGQYCSQFTARQMASPGLSQNNPESQLLLGVNDSFAAGRMRLAAETFYFPTQVSSREFLAWAKSRVAKRCPVMIGVFCNRTRFGEPLPGDEEYDHIVPVTAVRSRQSLADYGWRYFPSDEISFSDNGLYDAGGEPAYLYDAVFSRFPKSRRTANGAGAPVYSLKNTPNNYGLAVTGVLDVDRVTAPVRLVASRNDEPEMPDGGTIPPTPAPLLLEAIVSLPDTSVAYTLYRYDDFAKVPVSSFNARADDAVQKWEIPAGTGDTFRVTHETNTGATVVFRAVPSAAP